MYILLLHLGFVGSPLATSTTRVLLPLIVGIYIYLRKLHKQSWHGWSKESLSSKRILSYLKFSIPSGSMAFFEGYHTKKTKYIIFIHEFLLKNLKKFWE